jgi:hypothetical protein
MLNRIVWPLLTAGLVIAPAWAATDVFVGQWKVDPSRSKLTDEMKVTKLEANKYSFELGGGEPETIVVDGTDQPGFDGSTLSVAAEGPNWRVVRKKGGRIVISATWTLSHDGNSLTDDFTSFGENGTPTSVKYVYTRMARDTSGFAGTWVSKNETLSSPFVVEISPYETDGLTITGPSGTMNLNFDGKSARRLSPTEMEVSQRVNGKIVVTRLYSLSADHRTLTLTTHVAGRTFPNIFVFDRQ